ncbi:uncharacterized protein LOC141661003 [Apium graveolens]|uniref:uncharacterized protein LOC141661003 n=1 Tax=Apium graveolens TaxID=4045 RepID=UPI003D7B2A22
MMLNPAKCAFRVGSGKCLGLMVSKRVIEENPDKIKAILDMESPRSVKDVQKLTGRVVALGTFISKSEDKPKASGRLIKWAIKLGQFDIKYKRRTAMKAQALADFVVECTIPNPEVGGREDTEPQGIEDSEGGHDKEKELWVLYFDGASKINSSGAGLVLQIPDGLLIEYAMKLNFLTTNNEAEYEALIAGLGLAGTLGVKNLEVSGDSKLVVSQVKGESGARDEPMTKNRRLVRAMMTQFDECRLKHIPREENNKVDALSKFASSKIKESSGSVPDEARLALEEVHEGICGQYLGGRALAHKITRLGFYWQEMIVDAKEYVKRCDRCQKHAPVVRQPPKMLTSINSPIPFAMWGMNILEPFPMATTQRKFLIVAIDYFSKWIEAKPLAKIMTKQVYQFLTTCRVTTGATPFMLAYGAEAVVTLEISHSSPRIQAYNAEENEEGKRLALDLIDEVRDIVHAKIAKYQKNASFYYNLRVKESFFKQGDFVLRRWKLLD